MAFDVEKARADGVPDEQILQYLLQNRKFDVEKARADGVSDTQIIDYLAGTNMFSAASESTRPTAAAPLPTPYMQRSPSSRFVGNFAQNYNPIDIAKGLYEFRDPINALWRIRDQQEELKRQAWESMQSGSPVYGAGQAVLSQVPLGLGLPLQAGIDQIRGGDVAGGIGNLLGYATSFGAPELLRKLQINVPPILKNKNPQIEAAVKAEQAAGIPVPATAATGLPAVRTGADMAEFTFSGGVKADIAKGKLATAQKQRGYKLAERAYPEEAMTPETAGTAVREGAMKSAADAAETANELYSNWKAKIEEVPETKGVTVGKETVSLPTSTGKPFVIGGRPVVKDVKIPTNLTEVKTAFQEIYDDMMRTTTPEMRKTSPAFKFVDEFLKGDDVIGVLEAEQKLRDFKDVAGYKTDPTFRTQKQGLAKKAINGLEEAVDDALNKVSPELYNELKEARGMTVLKYKAGDVIKKLNDEPVKTFNSATMAHDAGINKLRQIAEVAPDELPKIGRAYLTDMIDKATESGRFEHSQALFSQWEKLGVETKKLLFKDPEYIRELDNFFTVAAKISETTNISGTARSLHSIQHMKKGGAALVGASSGSGIGFAGLELLGLGIANLIYSPKGVKLLTEGLKIAAGQKVATPAQIANLLRIAGQMAEENENQEEIQP